MNSVRKFVKNTSLNVLVWTGLMRLAELVSSGSLVVLTYHRVVPRDGRYAARPPNTLYTDEFDAQMKFVSSRFNVLDGSELKAVSTGLKAPPKSALAITFDDGYENNFEFAFPVLKKYGLHAAFFLTTDLIGTRDDLLWFDRLDLLRGHVSNKDVLSHLRALEPSFSRYPGNQVRSQLKTFPNARLFDLISQVERLSGYAGAPNADRKLYGLMNWDQVRELASVGMTIGSHTASHQILAAVSPEESYWELVRSRQRIELETARSCWCFAYPNGSEKDFRPEDEKAASNAGYACAFSQVSGKIGVGTASMPYRLPRIPVPDSGSLNVFRLHMSGIREALGYSLATGH